MTEKPACSRCTHWIRHDLESIQTGRELGYCKAPLPLWALGAIKDQYGFDGSPDDCFDAKAVDEWQCCPAYQLHPRVHVVKVTA